MIRLRNGTQRYLRTNQLANNSFSLGIIKTSMADDISQPDANRIWQVEDAFPGEHTMIYRESSTREVVKYGMSLERRVFRTRAVITDQGQPLNSSLEEVLTFVPKNRIRLPDGPFAMWKHYGGKRAVFFDLCADADGNFSAVEVDVSAVRPELALAYARASVNQLLDSLTFPVPHPLVIQRLELKSLENKDAILAYQITMPHQFATEIGRIGGIGPNGAFRGVEAILREAATNSSPYYRLMLAYRGFEGTKRIRRQFAAFVEKHKVQAPEPETPKVDRTEMARHGFRGKALGLESIAKLIEHYKELRDAAAHFFLGGRGKAASQHLQLSSTVAHTYAKVSALLLIHLRREVTCLKQYHMRYIAPLTHLGMILPVETARDRYVVMCPDDEAKAAPDEFN